MTLGEGGRIVAELCPAKHSAQGPTHFVNIALECDKFQLQLLEPVTCTGSFQTTIPNSVHDTEFFFSVISHCAI